MIVIWLATRLSILKRDTRQFVSDKDVFILLHPYTPSALILKRQIRVLYNADCMLRLPADRQQMLYTDCYVFFNCFIQK